MTIYYSHKNITEIEQKLNVDFSNLNSWFRENQLIINMKKGKTECMLFETQKSLNNLKNRKLDIQHNGLKVNNTSY